MGFKLLVGRDPSQDEGNDDEPHHRLLGRNVRPLTEVQGDRSWFLMRGWSCVSSAMNNVFRAKARYIEPDHSHCKDFELVSEFTGLSSLLPR